MNPLTEHTRHATQSDAGQIALLLNQLGYPASSESVSAKLHLLAANPHDAVLVAETDGRLAGVVSLHVLELFHAEGLLGRITSLVVDSAHRGKGTGGRLLQAADEYFLSCGCIRSEVTSGEHRSAAHAFYQAQGYRLDERRFVKQYSEPPLKRTSQP